MQQSQSITAPVAGAKSSTTNYLQNVCNTAKKTYLCGALHFARAMKPETISGIFYALIRNIAVPTPVWSVNAPTACARCNATGKRNRFYFSAKSNFLKRYKMHNIQTITAPVTGAKSINLMPACKAVAQFLTSSRLSALLGVLALVAVAQFQFTGEHPVASMAVCTVATLQVGVRILLSIIKEGGEL